MRRNGIDVYTRTPKDSMRAVAIVPAFVGMMSFIGVGMIPFWIHIVPFVLAAVQLYLTNTNIATEWSKDDPEYRGWQRYRRLPESYRKVIKISADDYYNMTRAQRDTFNSKVETITENYQQRMLTKSLDDGLVARLDSLIQHDDHELMLERTAQREIKQRGW